MTERSIQKPGDSAKLEWRGECCIEALAAQHEQLLGVLDESSQGLPVEIDLSGVSRIDTAGIQLLLGFVLDMRRRGRTVVLSQASESVVQAAQLAGVGVPLGL